MIEESNLNKKKLDKKSKNKNSSFSVSARKRMKEQQQEVQEVIEEVKVEEPQVPQKVEENPVTISSSKEEILDRVQKTSSIEELKDLTNLFGISLTKREIMRASKESDLMDKLLEQAEIRINEKADYLPHDVLLDYLKTFQTSVDKSRKTFNDDLDSASTKITNTHNEININVNEPIANMSRESRERVLDVMKVLFAKIGEEQNEVEEPEEVDVSEEENNQDD